MGILSRLFRLCKADVHGVMDQIEDKNLLLKQYLREMEEEIREKDNCLVRICQSCQQIQRDLTQRREEIKKLGSDLDLAVFKEKDDIARMLIRKRRTLQNTCEHLGCRKAKLVEDKRALTETLDLQRLQYDQMKFKVASFCQQVKQAPADTIDTSVAWRTPTHEEIELELLQRKEALQQGGAP
jgi:phage shock protein A